eukprot:TRINITY_DN1948_c0_g3_i1.p1 TRINITY_DN1948_c0_g3~~TRINITY_DN1948_c0_g3_i1.p1  ORF type:complete len:355 (+),score=101.27 TRINITY_DN1948_c0_g3_i1:134-1066(+)
MADSFSNSKIYPRIPERHRWLLTHFNVFLMCISASQILYCYVAKPETLSNSYLRFLIKFGNKDDQVRTAFRNQFFERPQDMKVIGDYCIKKGVNPDGLLRSYNAGSTMDLCEILHPGQTCVPHFFTFTYSLLRPSASMYMPLHFGFQIIFMVIKYFKTRKISSPIESFLKAAKNTVMSTLFLATYCAIAWIALCACTRSGFRGGFLGRKMIRLSMLAPGLAMLFEDKSRRTELALYCLPRAVESAYNDLYGLKWIPLMPSLENASPVIFSFSLAVFAYLYRQNPENIKSRYRWVLGWLWDEEKQENGERE